MDKTPTLNGIRSAVGSRSLKARETVENSLEALGRLTQLNALCSVQARTARDRADVLDAVMGLGRSPGPLAGVPLGLKDNVDQAGLASPAACRAYLDRVPLASATLVSRLLGAGAIPIARTNMHELADGVTSEDSCYGPVHNPWRHGHHPGGSSGGSAAAVAAGGLPATIGTDTGGSVRIPAALCGVVGFKPTTGLVPTDGIVPLSTSLDCAGPITRTVRDAAVLLQVLAGPAAHDYPAACGRDPNGMRIGVLTGFGQEVAPGVQAQFDQACGTLQELGCELESVAVDAMADGIRLLARIYPPEAAAWHARALRERPGAFGPAVRADLSRGSQADPDMRRTALRRAVSLARAMEDAMAGLDALVCPTTPIPAKPFGTSGAHVYLSHTCPFNLTGQPAVSLPMGLADGLPTGFQFIGRPNAEVTLFPVAAALEQALDFDCTPAVRAWE